MSNSDNAEQVGGQPAQSRSKSSIGWWTPKLLILAVLVAAHNARLERQAREARGNSSPHHVSTTGDRASSRPLRIGVESALTEFSATQSTEGLVVTFTVVAQGDGHVTSVRLTDATGAVLASGVADLTVDRPDSDRMSVRVVLDEARTDAVDGAEWTGQWVVSTPYALTVGSTGWWESPAEAKWSIRTKPAFDARKLPTPPPKPSTRATIRIVPMDGK